MAQDLRWDRLTVLVVDDNQTNRRILERMTQSDEPGTPFEPLELDQWLRSAGRPALARLLGDADDMIFTLRLNRPVFYDNARHFCDQVCRICIRVYFKGIRIIDGCVSLLGDAFLDAFYNYLIHTQRLLGHLKPA